MFCLENLGLVKTNDWGLSGRLFIQHVRRQTNPALENETSGIVSNVFYPKAESLVICKAIYLADFCEKDYDLLVDID